MIKVYGVTNHKLLYMILKGEIPGPQASIVSPLQYMC